MKHLVKIAGLCLASMLVVGMAITATASAAPHWLVCATGSGSGTKWTTNQCSTASSSGTFEWKELTGTEATRSHGSLVLADTKVPLVGRVSVQCTGEDVGSVGPGRFDRIEKINNIVCSPGENCEKIEKTAEPRNLPWQTELVEEGGKLRDKLKAENSKGAGWAVTCRVKFITKTDVCTTEAGSTAVENKATGSELLVLAAFDNNTTNAECELGGKEAGEVRGPDAILLASGAALAVSK